MLQALGAGQDIATRQSAAVAESLDEVFARDGYLRISSIADQGEVALIRQKLDEMWTAKTGFDRGYQFDLVGDDDENAILAFPQIIHPSTFAPELLKTRFFTDAEALARTLLGPKAKFSSDHALLKKAGIGPATPWHQDEAFRDPGFDYKEVSIWLALQPTNAANGCMKFIPGSNAWNVLPYRPLNGNEKIHAVECVGDFDAESAVMCPLPAGGCTVHGGRTLHAAGPNLSDQPRAAWVLIFALPARPNGKTGLTSGAPRSTARAEREKRWQRRGGAMLLFRRHLSRVDLRNPQEIYVFALKILRGGLKMISLTPRRKDS